MISIKKRLAHYAWDIAYGTYSNTILNDGLNGIKINVIRNHYKNKWFADPFILDVDQNNIKLLVEEFDNNVGRGRIARLNISKKNNEINECSIILDLPTHLSFPAIYRVDGEIYVHPENSASGASYIYRYDMITDKLIEPKLIVNEPIADAIIRKDGDLYHMFATRVPDTNGCTLHKYSSKNLFGIYQHFAKETYKNNTARMAGMFLISSNGEIIRPAQDCSSEYGKAVILYNGQNQLCRIEPTNSKYAGIHTFNTYKGSFVIDYKKYDYPLIYKLIRMLK